MASSYELIVDAAATGTGAGKSFVVSHVPVTISLMGASLGDVEADLEREDGAGNWQDMYKDAEKITLSATRTAEAIWAPGVYRLNYTARTNSVGSSHRQGRV